MSTTKNTAKTSTRWSIWNELLSSFEVPVESLLDDYNLFL